MTPSQEAVEAAVQEYSSGPSHDAMERALAAALPFLRPAPSRSEEAMSDDDLHAELNEAYEMVRVRDEELAALRASVARLEAALEFYADPDTYCAIGFFPDPPCGEFVDDFSDVDNEDYRRPMPGKRARAALERRAAEL